MNDFYMCINMNQDWILYCFEKYKRVRRMKTNPNFLNWLIQIFYFALFNFLQIHNTNNLFNKLLHIFLYLVNIILEVLELFLMGLISVLWHKLLLLTRYIYRKIVIKFLASLAWNNFNFRVRIPVSEYFNSLLFLIFLTFFLFLDCLNFIISKFHYFFITSYWLC